MVLASLLTATQLVTSCVTAGLPVDSPPDPQAIYGGELVTPGDWPAVVAVRTDKLCTGTLVAPDLVLTAAHCFYPAPPNQVFVDFGDATSGGADVQILAADWGAHEEFCLPEDCGEDLHDFAWIRLSQAVDVPPILPITDQDELDTLMAVGAAVTLVGFGQADDGLPAGSKRQVVTSITSYDDSGREFRAGGDGKDSCYGDSGGPALVQTTDGEWRLAGVLSRGGECGKGGIYGVPFPELCWLRDQSGLDLLPPGCEACDCVILPSPPEEDGCGCVGDRRVGGGLALSELGLLLGVLWWRRRRSLGLGE